MEKLTFVLKLAVRNLRLNSKKNLAALVSLVAGFMSINLFEGYMSGAMNLFNEAYEERFMYGDFVLHHEDAFDQSIFFDGESYITKDHQEALAEVFQGVSEIKAYVRRLNFNGMATNGELTSQIIGVGMDTESGEILRRPTWTWNTSGGRPIQVNAPEAILGEELGRLMACKLKDGQKFLNPEGGYIPKERPLDCPRPQLQITSNTETGSVNAIFVEVVGVANTLYRELDSRFIQVNLEDAQNLLNTESLSLITIKLKEGSDKKKVLEKLRSLMDNKGLPLTVAPWKESAFGEIYRQSMSFLNVLRGFFLVVILVIVMFSIMATQTRLVFERIKETATLRSLGFSETLVTQIFLAEAFLLAVVGATLGSLGSVLVSVAIKKIGFFYLIGILSEEVPFTIAIIGSNFLYSALVLVGLSVLACYIPVRKALSLSISEAFAHT